MLLLFDIEIKIVRTYPWTDSAFELMLDLCACFFICSCENNTSFVSYKSSARRRPLWEILLACRRVSGDGHCMSGLGACKCVWAWDNRRLAPSGDRLFVENRLIVIIRIDLRNSDQDNTETNLSLSLSFIQTIKWRISVLRKRNESSRYIEKCEKLIFMSSLTKEHISTIVTA